MVTSTGDIGRRSAFLDTARVLATADEPDVRALRRASKNACDVPACDLPMPVRDVTDEARA